MEWKEVRLGDVCNIITGFPFPGKKYSQKGVRVVRGDNVTIGNLRWDTEKDKRWNEPFDKTEYYSLQANDIVIGMDGSRVGKNKARIKEEDLPLLLAQRVACVRHNELAEQDYLYYNIFSKKFVDYVNSIHTGSAIPHISQKQIEDYKILLPNLETQHCIASILSSLDRKIELNNKINADLEEMAQAIFKNWFVEFEPFKDGKFVDSELGMIPEGWKVERLTEIASYMNGLAMQKFPPENNEDSLPVLKIKELGQGFCGPDSDRCSCNIKDECKIHNGDVIFSWSGTLLVDVWCGGDCGLNQHLFKVTSKDYPKWFYYYWTKHHLQEFIHIAKDKSVTMGHIKRGHLEEALVAIPDNDSMEKAHELFEPILSKMISLRLENSRLSLLRDTLLPRLMSGEIEVPE